MNLAQITVTHKMTYRYSGKRGFRKLRFSPHTKCVDFDFHFDIILGQVISQQCNQNLQLKFCWKCALPKWMNLFSKRSLRQYNKGSVISPPSHVVLSHPVKVRACKTDRDKQKNTVCRGKRGFHYSWILIYFRDLLNNNNKKN